MSKYNLTELLSEVKGGRIGTLNITATDLERKMEELEGEGITIKTFYDSPDGKTYVEYHVHPENKYDSDESFSIYDYKFGEDPTALENEDVEYPFSIGGRGDALSSAKALLGSGQVPYRIDENEAVDLAIEASQAKAGIEVDESFKSLAKKLDKQKGIDKDEAAKIAGSIAAKKAAGAGKGPTAKQKKRMNEDEDEDRKNDEDYEEGWIDNLEETDKYLDELDEGAMQPGEADLESGQTGNMDAYTEEIKGGKVSMKDAVLAIIKDTSATNPEIQMYVDSLTNDIKLNGKEAYADYEIDDYIEDFNEFISNKSLQEHFGRFMKDFQ
jgi:hypothetical protein